MYPKPLSLYRVVKQKNRSPDDPSVCRALELKTTKLALYNKTILVNLTKPSLATTGLSQPPLCKRANFYCLLTPAGMYRFECFSKPRILHSVALRGVTRAATGGDGFRV